jgi:hypothetical protein
MGASDGYRSLHQLTDSQRLAASALASGATSSDAAKHAKVDRVPVTHWASFVA